MELLQHKYSSYDLSDNKYTKDSQVQDIPTDESCIEKIFEDNNSLDSNNTIDKRIISEITRDSTGNSVYNSDNMS